ncbi:MAG: hypothetical protein GTO22_07995 [Gemmatimonadales bacterium]|nr:hypothetical protein [Gemmatimonadales bacterium]
MTTPRWRGAGRWPIVVWLLLVASRQIATAQADTSWSDVYVSDLAGVHSLISANHPGPVDAENPAFARTLETAYEEALGAAASITSYSAYRLALTRFVNRFQDAHLQLSFSRPLDDVREAGIYPVYRDGAFVVSEVDRRYGAQAAEFRGATLLECDGRSADEIFRQGVLSWRGRPSVDADWYLLAPYLLVDYGPPTPAAPSTCQFAINGRILTLPLSWTSKPGRAVAERVRELTSFGPRTLSLERLEEGTVVWVNVPTFAVYDSASIAAMHALIDSLQTEMTRNRRWDLLVFDLRGNSGGSSVWGDQMAKAVFGEAWIERASEWLFDGVYTEWRVSRDNIAALRGIVRQQEQRHGPDSENARYFRAFTDSMVAAFDRGDALIRSEGSRQGVARPPHVDVPGRILLLTSASCYSACLGFLDRMLLHTAVVQVGQPTGVDTYYMENWGYGLPSGLVRLSYPMKVYRNRRRAANQAYTPQVLNEQLDDTAAVRSWVLNLGR